MSKLALLGGEKTRKDSFPSHPVLGEEEKTHVHEVLESGILSGFIAHAGDNFLGGEKVKILEDEVRKYFNIKHAMTVNSATAGLHAALAAINVGPGDEVIVPPYTMSASASAIVMHNAVPVFVDIDEKTFMLDSEKIKQAITRRTKVILIVHLFGQPANMDQIMKIANEHNLKVIEDCAQAPGAIYKGKYVGTIGDLGIFSLNQHKTITTGEGGLVVTNDDDLALRVQLVRNHGEVVIKNRAPKTIAGILGWNYRMTELEAAVGIGQFKKLEKLTVYRIELAEYLTKRLGELNLPGILLPKIKADCRHVYFVYPIRYQENFAGIPRDTFVKALLAEGIPFGAGYVQPIYLEPMYQQKTCYGDRGCPFTCPFYDGNVKYDKGLCPVCERMHFKEVIMTGICRYPLKKEDIDDIVAAIRKIFEHKEELLKEGNK